MILTAALVLASATMGMAQQQPADAASGAGVPPSLGSIEVGARVTSTSGDEARYERYRDLRSGVPSNLYWGKETAAYLFNVKAENIGYRDQQYEANFANSKLKASFTFDSTPLNYGYNTVTPFVEQGKGTWTLDTSARVAVQNKTAVGILCAPGLAAGATCSNPTTAGLALSQVSVFRALAKPFDLQQRRDTMGIGVSYDATKDLSVDAAFQTVKKTGYQPWGASFAFNVATELPAPLDQRTNDLTLGMEWVNKQGMVRVAYMHSAFSNPVKSLLFDNPVRATDTTPYDASGYSNGNGPAQGRMALWPDSNMNVITLQGLYRMPAHTTLNGSLSLSSMKQNEALTAWTTNSAINNTAVWALFPGLKSLPRTSAEAEVKGVNAVLNFTSRPSKYVSFNARYRYNDHQNKSAIFDAVEYVRFDAVPEETGGETEHFNIKRDTLDLSTTLNLPRMSALKFQYVFDNVVRSSRSFSDMTDRTLRTSYDLLGTQYFTVRAMYEHTQRRGSGFSESAIEEGGAQPGLRFYDEADRTRNRGTLLLLVTPLPIVDVNMSIAAGKDKYTGEGHDLGLLSNKNNVVTLGVDVTPSDKVVFGASYGRDSYNAFQTSRNANPLSGVPGAYESWTDPNRIWNLTNDEKVNNVDAYLNLQKVLPKTDVRVAYVYSDSDNAFVHGGPRIQELATNTVLTVGDTAPCAAGVTSCFKALPNVTNTWQRFTVDAHVDATPKVAFVVSYWFEKFAVTDFATINLPGTDTPRIDYLGSLTTGYGNRPYKGNTAMVRVIYKF
jgi:MtrB/PioB family decaheme-associated outer membrane protein